MIRLYLLDSLPFFDTPYHLIGWIGWFTMAAIILWILGQNRETTKVKKFWKKFILLGLAAVFFALFLGLDLPLQSELPLPNLPRETTLATVMVFSFIPLMLAGGLLGVWPATLIGFITGLLISLWNTHSVFTPLETAALSLLISLALRQNYRTGFFRFLRRPIGAALLAILLSLPLFLVSTFFSTNGSLAAKLDYSFTQSWIQVAINGIQILVAGLWCELFMTHKWAGWAKFKTLQPSPIETGLQNRILYTALPMVLVLLLILAVADWIVAGKSAREMMQTQLENSARIAVENIPSILETGQSLTSSVVESNLPLNNKVEVQQILRTKIREIPFFSQLFVFDLTGAPLIGYPVEKIEQFSLSSEEEAGIQLALNGVMVQHYIIPPSPGGDSAVISFIASIPDEYGLAKGVVIARTSFSMNLFSQPAVLALANIKADGGAGAILDEANRILFHTNENMLMDAYEGIVPDSSGYFEDASSTGTRQLMYAAIDAEKGWKVVLSLPASYAQELALRIAIPLLAISLAASFLAYLLLRYMMKTLTSSLVSLAAKADEISKGDLRDAIEAKGVDEIGRLGSAFEQMRVSLKSRLDELDTLLSVSQGVASSLDVQTASYHLLSALLSYGADAASLVLVKSNSLNLEEEYTSYRLGEGGEEFAYLDRLLVDQLKNDSILIIPSKARIKRMGIPKDAPVPAAIAGISIRTGEEFNGFLWVVYSKPHRFLEAEVRFLHTLAGQAVLAVNNSNLYFQAEVGKRRLESVLSSTPEPVFVVNDAGQVLLSNQAVSQIEDLVTMDSSFPEGKGEVKSVRLKEYLTRAHENGREAEEIELENGRTYLVSISPIEVETSGGGRVCVLRDVTEYKEIEKKKSDFVSTVSHELKSPLNLIRGYASMIQMVGEMNEQQKDYSAKILEGIDSITRMSDNLLDLGRIESGVELQLEKISPFDLLEKLISLLQPQANIRKVSVQRELTFAPEMAIEADRVLLQQALFNLVENAIKFSPIGGKVNLRMQVKQEAVIFEIQDHGPGISPIDLPGIFDRYRKPMKKEENTARGSGLGLSIVKSITDRHQGKVWVESILGKGCTFFLEIPVKQKGKTGKKLVTKIN